MKKMFIKQTDIMDVVIVEMVVEWGCGYGYRGRGGYGYRRGYGYRGSYGWCRGY